MQTHLNLLNTFAYMNLCHKQLDDDDDNNKAQRKIFKAKGKIGLTEHLHHKNGLVTH